MTILLWIVAFTVFGGTLSVLAASLFLLIPEKYHPSVVPHGVSFAICALLSVAFLDLLPHALEATPHESREVFWVILLGLLAFFLLEKVLLWRHFHVHDWGTRRNKVAHFHHPAGALIVLGESIHNFVDGVLIAAAFLSDIHLGFATSLAIIAHEIPHEIGNFAVLLHSGYSRVKAFLYNLLSSLASLAGGILAFLGLENLPEILPIFLAVAVSNFVYVAMADLVPTLHKQTFARATIQQIVMIAAGVWVISEALGGGHR